jgi:hypothetical protein
MEDIIEESAEVSDALKKLRRLYNQRDAKQLGYGSKRFLEAVGEHDIPARDFEFAFDMFKQGKLKDYLLMREM